MLELLNPNYIGIKMQTKDNVIFIDFWDAFQNRIDKKIIDSCHKFNILKKPLRKNKDARNTIVYHLANFLLSNFVIKKHKENVAFIVCKETQGELELEEYFDEYQIYSICIKILKKFEKYLCFTVVEYEGSFEEFTKLLEKDKLFYKKIVSKIVNSLISQSSKNINMKDIQRVLEQYNVSNRVLKKNYTMKIE